MKTVPLSKSLVPGCFLALLAVLPQRLLATTPTPQFPILSTINADQTITYNATPKGDRVPNFSTVRYNNGDPLLPDEPGSNAVPVVFTLAPQSGDQTDRIQAALDFIAPRPLVNGFRGALLLKADRREIHSVNKITGSDWFFVACALRELHCSPVCRQHDCSAELLRCWL